jgi:hypothetical protein
VETCVQARTRRIQHLLNVLVDSSMQGVVQTNAASWPQVALDKHVSLGPSGAMRYKQLGRLLDTVYVEAKNATHDITTR